MTDDPIEPTPAQAKKLIQLIDNMLPEMLAAEERDVRRNQTNARRREGITLSTADEVKGDLTDALDTLLRHIYEHQGGAHKHMQTPGQMLAYIERACVYAMRDYPRHIEGNATIIGLWDTFDRMHTGAHEWRKGTYPHDSAPAIIASIRRIAEDAIEGRFDASSNADSADAENDA